MAIELATEATFTPRAGTFLVGITSDQFPGMTEIPLRGPTASLPPHARLAASIVELAELGTGGEMHVTSTVPVGSGLSSSAAFSVALFLALGTPADPRTVALACQAAEAAAGAAVGLLDPLAIMGGSAGHALHIDFATLEMRPVPVPAQAAFVVVHCGASRQLSGSPYATRRAECERAANQIGRPLGLCNVSDLSVLSDPVLRRRARHVITECARVREVERLLARGNLAGVGAVMTDGHRSLAGDYKASIPALEELVEFLLTTPGVLGARMTGGGFGGCAIALCTPDSPALDLARYAPRRAWRVSPSPGAALLATSPPGR